MRLIEQRFLKGPNRWGRGNYLQLLIDLGSLQLSASADLPGLTDRLTALLPGLEVRPEALHGHGLLAELLGIVMLELQRPADTGQAVEPLQVTIGRQGQVRMLVSCGSEAGGAQACAAALAIFASVLGDVAARHGAPLRPLPETTSVTFALPASNPAVAMHAP